LKNAGEKYLQHGEGTTPRSDKTTTSSAEQRLRVVAENEKRRIPSEQHIHPVRDKKLRRKGRVRNGLRGGRGLVSRDVGSRTERDFSEGFTGGSLLGRGFFPKFHEKGLCSHRQAFELDGIKAEDPNKKRRHLSKSPPGEICHSTLTVHVNKKRTCAGKHLLTAYTQTSESQPSNRWWSRKKGKPALIWEVVYDVALKSFPSRKKPNPFIKGHLLIRERRTNL